MKIEGPMLDKCRVCTAANFTYLCDTYNEHSKTTWISHFRCSECGSVFVGNDVDGEELGVAYSSIDSTTYYGDIESQSIKKLQAACEYLTTEVARDANIIDIGTGNGLFVEVLRDAGFSKVSAHEIIGNDLTKISGLAFNIYQDFDYSSIPSDSFDVITLLDVVEHVIDPHYLIKNCARILKTGGLLHFHTPVVTKTDRFMHVVLRLPALRKVGLVWQRGRTSIFHLQNYTPKALVQILEQSGFNGIEVNVKNELSWPINKYVRIYLLQKQGIPKSVARFIAPLLSPLFFPLLATDLFNANKAIVSARKVGG